MALRATLGACRAAALLGLLGGCRAPIDPAAMTVSATAIYWGSTGLEVATTGAQKKSVRVLATGGGLVPGAVHIQAGAPEASGGSRATFSGGRVDGEGRTELVLPAGANGELGVFVRDEAGKLVGSGLVPADAQARTEGELEVIITPNTANAHLVRTDDGLNSQDGVVVIGATVTLDSGIMNGMPGVDRVEVEISGPAYGDGRETATIGSLRAPDLNTYQWSPAVVSGTYDPGKLASPGTPIPFVITTKAYDALGRLVGSTQVQLAVIGAATVTIGVDADSTR